MEKLTSVSIFNLKDEIILSNATGTITQGLVNDAYDTSLSLSGVEGNKLQANESYYAVALNEQNNPVRSEIVQCVNTGASPTFQGSIKRVAKPATTTAVADPGADIQIKYTNYSTTQFNIGISGANLQDGFGGLTSSPGPLLLANSGVQSIGASQLLSVVSEGPADIWLEWIGTGIKFGVWIHFNFQMFDAGYRPVWYVTTNGSAMTLSGTDPSTPFTWNPAAVGFNIIATPASGHSSLLINVVITDLKK